LQQEGCDETRRNPARATSGPRRSIGEERSHSAPEVIAIDQDLHISPRDPPGAAHEPETEDAAPARRGRRALWAWLLGLGVLIAAATFVYEGEPTGGNQEQDAKPEAPVPVTVTEAALGQMPVYFDGLGTVQASNTVAIRTQVSGKLQSVDFVEGQRVKRGDVLAVVDPRPFQAALDQANAKRAEDEAQLVSDQKDLGRFKDLVKKGAGTQQSVDQQQAKVDNLKATIEADQAGIEAAETQLSYTKITAPIDGRVGLRQVDAGNIVSPSDQTPITVLTEIAPAAAIVTLPQRDLGPLREAMLKGDVGVIAFDQDNTRELGRGKLLLIDNQIDQSTSTIKLKASFPNEDERLWPGEFIRARVLVDTLKDVVLVPPAVVQRSTQGLFAWAVTPENKAERRAITTGPSDDSAIVVASGLKAGDRVVLSGQYRLREGVTVEPKEKPGPVAQPLAP
jgi:multidrug efflux system membrane fusion protein